MFPNGHVSCMDAQGFFEAMVCYTREELARFNTKTNPKAAEDMDWDICNRATGSGQLAHRTISRVGALPDGGMVFHLRFSGVAMPTEKVGSALAEIAGHPYVDPAFEATGETLDPSDDRGISVITLESLKKVAASLSLEWLAEFADAEPTAADLAKRRALEAKLLEVLSTMTWSGEDPRQMTIEMLLPDLDVQTLV